MATTYPTAFDDDNSLWLAKSGFKCTLTVDPGTGGTTLNVDTTTGAAATGYVGLDAEMVSYTGTTPTAFTGCTRGADGTAASSHAVNTTVYGSVAADHHNALKDAIKALEKKVGVNTNGATATTIDAAQLAGSSSASIANLYTTGRVGVGTGAPGAPVHIKGNDGLTNLRIENTLAATSSLEVQAAADGSIYFKAATVPGGATGSRVNWARGTGGTLFAIALDANGHLQSPAAGVAISAVNAGISGAVTAVGSDTAGYFSFLTTGAAPGAGAALFTVTFNTTYGVRPAVILTANQQLVTFVAGNPPTATAFTVYCVGALANGTTYSLSYVVVGLN